MIFFSCSSDSVVEKRPKKDEGGLLSGWSNKLAKQRLGVISGLLFILFSKTWMLNQVFKLVITYLARLQKIKSIHLSLLEGNLMSMNLSNQLELLAM